MAPGAVTKTRLAALRRAAPLWLGLALVIAFYAFVVGAGRVDAWYSWSRLYDGQAEGFRAGHLYLPEQPSAALRALPDPYNPANMRFWRWDHTYYKGRFYLYWGLVPAVLLAAVKSVFRIRQTVGDEVLTFWLFVGRLVAGTLLLRALAASARPAPPRWAVGLAIAVFALAHPTPYTLARGAVYEVAIMSGVSFLLAGLYLGWRGMNADRTVALRWLAAASFSLGLAGGSRPNLLPAVVLVAVWTAFTRWRAEGGDGRRLARVALATCAPAAAVVLAHFVLNHLRYGDWSEFGARYQLGNGQLTFGARFVPVNLLVYLLLPPSRSCTFPFISAEWNGTRGLLPRWVSWPADHRTNEPTIGLFVAASFTLLALVAAVVAAVRFVRRRRAGAPPRPLSWSWRWLWGALGLGLLTTAAPLLLLCGTTMRYELDFASFLVLMAILGGWWLLSLPRSRSGRIAVGAGYAVLAAVTLVSGVLLGFTGYFVHFARHNPALLHTLERALSVCGR
jgi:hypothetical protein